jgi:hypothetical protein
MKVAVSLASVKLILEINKTVIVASSWCFILLYRDNPSLRVYSIPSSKGMSEV